MSYADHYTPKAGTEFIVRATGRRYVVSSVQGYHENGRWRVNAEGQTGTWLIGWGGTLGEEPGWSGIREKKNERGNH